MCGIFGWQFKRGAKIGMGQREAMAATLAVANSARGDQSWGVLTDQGGGKRKIRKAVGDIARVSGLGALGRCPTVMAHTRYATAGAITVENCHPFTAGKVTLAHNGVIFNAWDLDRTYDRDCAVDSMHLAMHLAEGKDLSDVDGYGAIEWVEDDHPGLVYLCRLEGGQLAVSAIKDKGETVGVVWSSDERHLERALSAAYLIGHPYKVHIGTVYQVECGVLYKSGRPDLALSDNSWGDLGFWQNRTSGGAIDRYAYLTDEDEYRDLLRAWDEEKREDNEKAGSKLVLVGKQ